jgi:hypothetical protein
MPGDVEIAFFPEGTGGRGFFIKIRFLVEVLTEAATPHDDLFFYEGLLLPCWTFPAGS